MPPTFTAHTHSWPFAQTLFGDLIARPFCAHFLSFKQIKNRGLAEPVFFFFVAVFQVRNYLSEFWHKLP